MAKDERYRRKFEEADPVILSPGETVEAAGTCEPSDTPSPMVGAMFGAVGSLVLAGAKGLRDGLRNEPLDVEGGLAASWPGGRFLVALTSRRLVLAAMPRGRKPASEVIMTYQLAQISELRHKMKIASEFLDIEFVDGSVVTTQGFTQTVFRRFSEMRAMSFVPPAE